MRGFSKAIIAGNVTRDPEMRSTPNGAQVCSFSVAVNRQYKGSDGTMQEQTSFLDCVAWGRQGETIAQYVHKGSALLVSGRLEQRSWDDKTTGQKRSRVEIIVEDFTFLGGDRGGDYGGGYNNGGAGLPRSVVKPAPKTAAEMAADFAPDDVPAEESINLEEIPF